MYYKEISEVKMANKEDFKKRILEEEDFIKCPRSSNSLQKFLIKAPEVVEDKAIAKLLMIEVEEVQKIYDEAVKKIKEDLSEEDAD